MKHALISRSVVLSMPNEAATNANKERNKCGYHFAKAYENIENLPIEGYGVDD